jgi:hypothetical protein
MDPSVGLKGYLAHEKKHNPLGPPYDPGCSPAVGPWQGGVSYERGTPVAGVLTQNELCSGPTGVPRSKQNACPPKTQLGP